jgi:hypothetical protein
LHKRDSLHLQYSTPRFGCPPSRSLIRLASESQHLIDGKPAATIGAWRGKTKGQCDAKNGWKQDYVARARHIANYDGCGKSDFD